MPELVKAEDCTKRAPGDGLFTPAATAEIEIAPPALQARRCARLFALPYYTALTIAQLAYEVRR